MKSVLFVCLGNICRSPTAEALFRRALPGQFCDSAGTGDWHVGKPPYGPMQQAALARDLDMSDLRARQITVRDFSDFDMILAMDADNVKNIEALRPAGNTTPVKALARFGTLGVEAVPDPYFTRDFDEALDILEDSVSGLVQDLTP